MRTINQLAFAAVVVLFAACKTPTDISYFQDLENLKEYNLLKYDGIRLKPTDKLLIVVKCKNAEITNMLNLGLTNQIIGVSENATLSQNNGVSGYIIDPDGNIDFPLLGKIHIAGLTRSEVEKKIKHDIEEAELAKDVVVTADYMNMRYYVLGEVKSPGVKGITHDRLTITEALAQSGDLSIYGVRDSIYVIRQAGDKKISYRVNLLNAEELVKSPVYYIQPNDVIYVEQKKIVARNAFFSSNTSIWFSLTSSLMSIATFIIAVSK